MLEPLEIKDNEGNTTTLTCRHKDVWPPGWSKSGQPVEALRAQGLLNAGQYERAKTWERVCGLQAMNASKCPTCPHALKENGLPVVSPPRLVAPGLPNRRPRR